MPCAEKTTFDRDELNKMTRQEIQQLAKKIGIKANGKTDAMRAELMKRQKPIAPAHIAPQTATNTRNRRSTRRQPKEEAPTQPELTGRATRQRRSALSGVPDSAIDVDTNAAPSGSVTHTEPIIATDADNIASPSIEAHTHSKTRNQRVKASSGAGSTSLGGSAVAQQAEGPSGAEMTALSSSWPTGPENPEQVGTSGAGTATTCIPTLSLTATNSLQNQMQGVADVCRASPAPVTVPPNLQQVDPTTTGSQKRVHTVEDVRAVRRRIASLIDDQADLRGEFDEVSILLDPTEDRLLDCEQILQALSWRREAIEQTVLVRFKAHHQLWDGTHLPIGANDTGSAWQLHGNFEIPPHRPEYLSDDDDDADSQTSISGQAALSQAGSDGDSADEMEVRPAPSVPKQVVDDDDDMDDFYL